MIRPPIVITAGVLATLRAAAAGMLTVADDERAFPPADPTIGRLLDADLVELDVSTTPLLLDRWTPTGAGVDILEWYDRIGRDELAARGAE
jgi:hypothetical protein